MRVIALANRLRLVQLDLADQTPESRREHLTEELHREVVSLQPDDRDAFLNDLQDYFPTWDGKVDVTPAPVAATQGAIDKRELEDPAFLVARLIEVCRPLPEASRQMIILRLREAGLATESKDWPDAQSRALKTRLGITDAVPLDSQRILELADVLCELACLLDPVAWKIWREISPQNQARRALSMQQLLAHFLSGEQDSPYAVVNAEIKKLRALSGALMAVISQAGQFALNHMRRLSPDEIKILVETEWRGGIWPTRPGPADWWRKYAQLFGDLNDQTVISEIRRSIAEYVRQIVDGPNRPNRTPGA